MNGVLLNTGYYKPRLNNWPIFLTCTLSVFLNSQATERF